MKLAFVVPAFGRFELTSICLRQLRETCRELDYAGLQASAIVIGDDENLEVAGPEGCGFHTVEQANEPLGRKWNDGFERAAELGFDFVVPFGTDNWIDPELILSRLPVGNEVVCHRLCALVDERGERLARLQISYPGGDGIKILPLRLLEPVAYRPAAETRGRAIDASIRETLRRRPRADRPVDVYHDLHPLQVVGFQSRDVQLNGYAALVQEFGIGPEERDPWSKLEGHYPSEAISEMSDLYAARRRRKVAA